MISNQQKALTVFRLGGWRYIRSATATTAIDFRSEGPGFYSSSEMFFAVQLNKIWFMGSIGGTIIKQSAAGFYSFRAGRRSEL